MGHLLISLAIVALAAAQDRESSRVPAPPSGIVVYEDADFGGRSRTVSVDVSDLRPSGLNDRISSVIVAAGETWELCTDREFSGRCTLISGREPNLNDVGWNDQVSSMRRVRARPGSGRGGGRDVPSPFQRLELFAGTNYSGERKVISDATDNFRDIGFNDRASSLRLIGGGSWEICMNADFDDCRVVDASLPDLRTIGFDRLISSARPRPSRRDRGQFPPPERERLVLFARAGFAGNSMAITEARPSLGAFNDRAQSVRVISGRWELCEAQNYGGRCITVTDDVRDLGRYRLDGQIRSVRPR